MFKPAGDTVIVRKVKPKESVIELPDNLDINNTDVFEILAVGIGYVTEQGVIIAPEVKVGDKAVINGDKVRLNINGEEIIMARAQDIIAYEEGEAWKK